MPEECFSSTPRDDVSGGTWFLALFLFLVSVLIPLLSHLLHRVTPLLI